MASETNSSRWGGSPRDPLVQGTRTTIRAAGGRAPWICPRRRPRPHAQPRPALCTAHWTHLRAELREADDSSAELAGAAGVVGSGSPPGKGWEGKGRGGGGERVWRGGDETRRGVEARGEV